MKEPIKCKTYVLSCYSGTCASDPGDTVVNGIVSVNEEPAQPCQFITKPDGTTILCCPTEQLPSSGSSIQTSNPDGVFDGAHGLGNTGEPDRDGNVRVTLCVNVPLDTPDGDTGLGG